jgi:hypothetical protein
MARVPRPALILSLFDSGEEKRCDANIIKMCGGSNGERCSIWTSVADYVAQEHYTKSLSRFVEEF